MLIGRLIGSTTTMIEAIFSALGIYSGHMAEWAKLRLISERHRSVSCLLPRAEQLFNIALEYAWD